MAANIDFTGKYIRDTRGNYVNDDTGKYITDIRGNYVNNDAGKYSIDIRGIYVSDSKGRYVPDSRGLYKFIPVPIGNSTISSIQHSCSDIIKVIFNIITAILLKPNTVPSDTPIPFEVRTNSPPKSIKF